MLNKIFKILIFCIFSELFWLFPKGIRLKSLQFEMRAFTESLIHKILFNTEVYGCNEIHIIMHNLKT